MSEPISNMLSKVYFTALPTPVADMVAADLLDGINEVTVTVTSDTTPKNYYGGGGWSSSALTLRKFSGSLGGHRFEGSTSQGLLKQHFMSGADGYLTIITNEAGTPGKKGVRYAVKITSFDETGPSTDVRKLSCAFDGQGAPLDV
ncbi:hypothetical protein JGU66_18750 [Myxococcaceae bacterium JPH2]|nr:hypothetical protein [Myxococcaceae bacterium JPH2]